MVVPGCLMLKSLPVKVSCVSSTASKTANKNGWLHNLRPPLNILVYLVIVPILIEKPWKGADFVELKLRESEDGDSFLRVGIDNIAHALFVEDGFSLNTMKRVS